MIGSPFRAAHIYEWGGLCTRTHVRTKVFANTPSPTPRA